jgi:hypothetical protein
MEKVLLRFKVKYKKGLVIIIKFVCAVNLNFKTVYSKRFFYFSQSVIKIKRVLTFLFVLVYNDIVIYAVVESLALLIGMRPVSLINFVTYYYPE